MEVGVVSLFALIVTLVLFQLMDAPWAGVDVLGDIAMMNKILEYRGGVDWQPLGNATFFRVAKVFGLSPIICGYVLATLKWPLLFSVFRTKLGFIFSFITTGVLLLMPPYFQISLLLGTENLLTNIIFFSLFLLLNTKSFGLRLLCLGFVIFLSLQVRHAALFYVPGLCFFMLRDWSSKFALIAAFAVAGLAFMGSNLWNTNHAFKMHTGPMSCIQAMVAHSDRPLCELNATKTLCQYEGREGFFPRPTLIWGDMGYLVFNPKSPFRIHLTKTSVEDTCKMAKDLSIELWSTQFGSMFVGLFTRFIQQYGSWDSPETQDNISLKTQTEKFKNAQKRFIQLLNIWRPIELLFGVLLIGVLVFSIINGKTRAYIFQNPFLLGLILMSITHALGVAINNPFRALRYIAMAKIPLYIAGVFCIGEYLRKKRSKF